MAIQPQVDNEGASGAGIAGPEWDSIQEEIFCPLCDYNLRGLIEPRCPECGYRFAWPDLLDPARRRHPFAFEHHPERRVWAWWKTSLAALRPRRFWASLHPYQPSYPKRLFVYWLINVVGLLLLVGLFFGVSVPRVANANAASNAMQRAQYNAYLNSPAGAKSRALIVTQYGSISAHLNMFYPGAVDYKAAAGQVLVSLGMMGPLLLSIPLWPWLTTLSLMVFQISMRRRRVRAAHVMRCVMYNQDVLVLTALPIFEGMIIAAIGFMGPGVTFGPRGALSAGIAIVGFAVFVYRMTVAYKLYMNFDRPIATVLASQVITGLVCLNILVLPMLFR